MFGLDPTLITFSIYIFGMILIGVLAYYYTNNLSDYISVSYTHLDVYKRQFQKISRSYPVA